MGDDLPDWPSITGHAITLSDPSPLPDDRHFDLLVRGGQVIDPSTGRSGLYDIGVLDGRIARVAPDIPVQVGQAVVEAGGCIVVPGLVDLHTHIFFSGTYWGIDPAAVAWRTGVTSWVDAGSAGAYNIAALLQLCATLSPLRARVLVNISAIGLVAETGESRRAELCDAAACAAALEEHREIVVGVKCRLDRFAVGEMGIQPLRSAIEAAAAVGVPVMVHIGAGPPDIDDVLDLLRPGDIVTHCTTGQSMSLVEGTGRLRPSAVDARQRGVLFDVGHGSGAFSFSVTEAMLGAGFPPDVISSDLHQRSLLGPAFDLPTCMSKFLALGMSVEEVVRATTVNPARAIRDGLDAGSLEVGRTADLAVFELEAGDFVLYDTYLERRRADRLFVNRATVAGGVLLPPVPAPAPANWITLSADQHALVGRSASELRRPWAVSLTEPGSFVPYPMGGPPSRSPSSPANGPSPGSGEI